MNRFLLLASLASASGCSSTSSSPQPAARTLSPGASQESVAALSERLDKVADEVRQLQTKVATLESAEADVSTEEETYAIARTNFGPFTVVARSVTPYLDGYRVRLFVGNLTSATFQGAKVKVTWGYDANNPAGFAKTRMEKTFDIAHVFAPGAYSNVDVTLTPAKANEIKSIWVGIELSRMSLRGR